MKKVQWDMYKKHRSCWRKKKFNEVEAEHMEIKWKQRKYQCNNCGWYHMTKKEVT